MAFSSSSKISEDIFGIVGETNLSSVNAVFDFLALVVYIRDHKYMRLSMHLN